MHRVGWALQRRFAAAARRRGVLVKWDDERGFGKALWERKGGEGGVWVPVCRKALKCR